ncbi:MAG: shikimate kinase [bacterium]|nr:shikimate kinase [bacterium]
MQKHINNIVLVGFMGTGKTTVGKLLANKLNWSYVDTDTLIEQKNQHSIPAIFEQYGEPYFRDRESEVIQEVMQKQQQIVATGGGIVLRDQNIAVMKSNGMVICLTATPAVIFERTKSDAYRPLLKVTHPQQRIQELLESRASFYAKADITIDTSTLSPEDVVKQILTILRNATDNHGCSRFF